MARTTAKGLFVWDLTTDVYNHTQLAANWDLIDSLVGTASGSITTSATLPSTGNFGGRVVILSAADGGFPAWTMVRHDGSAWRPVGQMEIQPSLPASGNFAGRVVILSAATTNFSAWDVVRYDGSAWEVVGGWRFINNGAGATNIKGFQTTGDAYISSSARGLVLVDRTTGAKRRLFFDSGNLESEVVT